MMALAPYICRHDYNALRRPVEPRVLPVLLNLAQSSVLLQLCLSTHRNEQLPSLRQGPGHGLQQREIR